MKTLTAQLVLMTALLVPSYMFGQTAYTEALINLPGTPQAYGIDDDDQVVGLFYGTGGTHGFIFSGGVLGQIDAPQAFESYASAINSKTGIVMVTQPNGSRLTENGVIDVKDRFKTVKGSLKMVISGINASGTVVGMDQKTMKGFIAANGVYTTIVPALCKSLPAPISVYVTGINTAGDFVGYCYGVNEFTSAGFSRIGGVYQLVSVFGSRTYPTGINDSGTIAGWYDDGSSFLHGFTLSGGVATQFDFAGPNTNQTKIMAINNKGSLTGLTFDHTNGTWVGFYALAN